MGACASSPSKSTTVDVSKDEGISKAPANDISGMVTTTAFGQPWLVNDVAAPVEAPAAPSDSAEAAAAVPPELVPQKSVVAHTIDLVDLIGKALTPRSAAAVPKKEDFSAQLSAPPAGAFGQPWLAPEHAMAPAA